jgi:hypothetical protein
VARFAHSAMDAGEPSHLLPVDAGTSWIVAFAPEGDSVILSAQDRNASIRVKQAELSELWQVRTGD